MDPPQAVRTRPPTPRLPGTASPGVRRERRVLLRVLWVLLFVVAAMGLYIAAGALFFHTPG